MYVAQLPHNRIAARQRWNARGAYFPETAAFDGATVLPDDVALEYRRIFLALPDRAPLSDRARELGRYEATLQSHADNGSPDFRYAQISHIWTTGAKIAVHAWWRYRCTGDTAWLRTHAYPLLRDTAEFYHSVAIKKADGKYHLEGSNVHESFMGVNESLMDLGAIRGVVPLAIRAAEALGVDAALRAQWREFLDNLVPYPMGTDPEARALDGAVLADDVWAIAHQGDGGGAMRGDEDLWLTPVFPFETYTLETRDPETARIVNKLVDLAPVGKGLFDGTVSAMSTAMRSPIIIARAGRGESLPVALCSYYNAFPPLPNGLSTFEGGALSAEQMGVLAATMQDGAMQSLSATPGAPEAIRVFPAWPKSWDATFSLVARGGFLVTSTIKGGAVGFIEIVSRLGETCRVHNPWGHACFLAEEGKAKQRRTGELLEFPTVAGRTYQLFPESPPATIVIAPKDAAPNAFVLTLPSGKEVKGRLG